MPTALKQETELDPKVQKKEVVPPNPDEEVRQYTVQHTLVSLPDGRYLNAGQTLNSDDFMSKDGDEKARATAEKRFVDAGAVMLTKTVTRVVAERAKAEAAAKGA